MIATRWLSVLGVVAVVAAAACGAPAGTGSEIEPAAPEQVLAMPSGPPTLDELKNATYRGLESPDGPFDLVGGRWEGAPFDEQGASRPTVTFADDFRVLGDLDNDGVDEAAVVLAASSGGSGTFDYLALVDRTADGRLDNLATVPLGDRVQIRNARIEDRRVVVDAVRAGPNDAACCPGELVRWAWTLEDGVPEQVVSEATGRLSLETIAGTEWVLERWAWNEPAPAEPEVTLTVVDSRLAGSSGCNRYSATVEAAESPGDVSIGPVAGTRMACPEQAASVEQRFLSQLERVITYGFVLGKLGLTYQNDDGSLGVMLLQSRAVRVEPS